MTFSDFDTKCMRLALKEAKKGRSVSPNPMVGAVVARKEKIISTGYHKYFGGRHAEVSAIENAKEGIEGSTLYVTLEPCSTFGKTPPCTDAIIASGVKRVVAAVRDPNPMHEGRGFEILKKARIEVQEGLCGEEAEKLNKYFFYFIKSKLPYVLLKTAMSLDGKIAAPNGESRWITGEKSRKIVHKLRAGVDAVMVGVRTVIMDDPELNVRLIKGIGKQPKAVVLDREGTIPEMCKLLMPENAVRTIVVVSKKVGEETVKKIESMGAKVLRAAERDLRLELSNVMSSLGELGIMSVLAECGGSLAFSLLKEKLVNEVHYFIAPKIIGGKGSPSAVDGEGVAGIDKAIPLDILEIKKVGGDLYVVAKPGKILKI